MSEKPSSSVSVLEYQDRRFFHPAEKQAVHKSHVATHLKDQASCYIALIRQNQTRRQLEENGRLTGRSSCATETNKSQVLKER